MTEFVLHDLPQKSSVQTYRLAVHDISEVLLAEPAVISVYQVGSVGCPGISDIDLVVVLRGKPSSSFMNNVAALRSKHGAVFTHDPFYVSRRLFQKLEWLLYTQDLCHVAGEKITINSLSKEESLIRDERVVIDYLFFYWSREFMESLLGRPKPQGPGGMIRRDWQEIFRIKRDGPKVLPVRTLLLRLHSFTYTIRLFNTVYDRDVGTQFISNVQALRKNWFKKPASSAQLLDLLREANKLAYIMIGSLPRNEQCGKTRYSYYAFFHFMNDWESENAQEMTVRAYEDSRVMKIFLPCVEVKRCPRDTLLKEQILFIRKAGLKTGHFFSFQYPYRWTPEHMYFLFLTSLRRLVS